MGIRVLLIDDSPVDRELAARTLGGLAAPLGPVEVIAVGSWAQAQSHLAAGNLDLMLLDYHLPDLDGLAVLQELDRLPHPPVIMTTGQSDLGVAVETLRHGAYDYVSKDVDGGPALCLAVERVLERVRLERALAESRARLEAYASELEAKVEARTSMVRTQAAEIEALYLRSEEAARIKAEIVSNLSHELRTPLNIIMGYHELLEGELSPESAAHDMLNKVRGQVTRLHEVLQSLLTLAQLRSGTIGVTCSRFLCSALIEELRADAVLLNADKGLALEWQSPSDRAEVEHDREKIRAVAYHLLSNAIKFTHAGRVVVTLAPSASGSLVLTVADTGVGFPHEARGLIFEDFRQLDGSSTRSFEGLGLGLGIVNRYTSLLGGTIAIESVPGQGTTVRVEFPLPVVVGAPAPAAAPARRRPHVRRTQRKSTDLATDAVVAAAPGAAVRRNRQV
ncbi:MAG: response regulator [Deltaproteobacteria bacterium]|nr:response regulator [Deltaproteobacteria bacterium]